MIVTVHRVYPVSQAHSTRGQREDARRSTTAYHLLVFPAAAACMWLMYHPWPLDHWSCRAAWVLLASYALLSLSSCLHETVHHTYCRSPRLNVAVGRIIGTLFLVPYTVYRESHIRHHGHLNRPTDWELWPYSDPSASRTFRRIFVWFDLFLGTITTPYIYGRIFFHKNSPIALGGKIWRTMLYEYMAVAIVWGTFLGTLEYYGKLGSKHALWLLPLWLMTFLQTGRKLTEHLGMDSFDPIRGTRTVVGGNLMTRVCSYLQFDIFVHGPHHRHPKMPHTKLRATMEGYLTGDADTYPAFSTYRHAVLDMLPHLLRHPGCGVNARRALANVATESDCATGQQPLFRNAA